ncbi:MAG: DUF5605 domain-containing protein [Firmicutes bacterium]|nr:DUF5605 domain-containing protein [Bacillota bacterium]
MQSSIPLWGMWEFTKEQPVTNRNPFDLEIKAVFQKGNRKLTSYGFYDGSDTFKIRFMPDCEGEWAYEIFSEIPGLNGITGCFTCTPPEEGEHGVARTRGLHFAYDDGSPLYPLGTTCYAWVHQPAELRRQTIESLKKTPGFKKIRMCVFPKHYDFNKNEPELYPFEGNLETGFDYTRPNPKFYAHLEQCIWDLKDIGVEADLILFYAYDHWGFAKMDQCCNRRYLKYIAYLDFSRPRFRAFHSDHPYLGRNNLPKGNYKVDIIDTWNMTITDCGVMAMENLYVELPARQYMAVRFTVVE